MVKKVSFHNFASEGFESYRKKYKKVLKKVIFWRENSYEILFGYFETLCKRALLLALGLADNSKIFPGMRVRSYFVEPEP